MNFFKQTFVIILLVLISGCNSKSKNHEEKPKPDQQLKLSVKKEIDQFDEKENDKFLFTDNNVKTQFGNIDIQLFDNTPYHRSNFIYLTKKKYFDGTQFYRVINDFVIQAGNSDNIKISEKRREIGKYLLPNDFDKGHTHQRGMVSMPSSSVDNPYKMASPFEFFIVQKKDGAHHLDGSYTIFGKVVDGMKTVDQIANLPTDDRDWPFNNVYINRVEIINNN